MNRPCQPRLLFPLPLQGHPFCVGPWEACFTGLSLWTSSLPSVYPWHLLCETQTRPLIAPLLNIPYSEITAQVCLAQISASHRLSPLELTPASLCLGCFSLPPMQSLLTEFKSLNANQRLCHLHMTSLHPVSKVGSEPNVLRHGIQVH